MGEGESFVKVGRSRRIVVGERRTSWFWVRSYGWEWVVGWWLKSKETSLFLFRSRLRISFDALHKGKT